MVKEIHKHIIITDDNDEYPIFDDNISSEEMDECIVHSKKIIKNIKEYYGEGSDY